MHFGGSIRAKRFDHDCVLFPFPFLVPDVCDGETCFGDRFLTLLAPRMSSDESSSSMSITSAWDDEGGSVGWEDEGAVEAKKEAIEVCPFFVLELVLPFVLTTRPFSLTG